MTEMTDKERTIRALYEEQAGLLYSYAVRLLGGDRHRAEDVVQEALLRCWRTQDLTSGRPLWPWLFRVARDLVVDDYRPRMDTDEVPGADERERTGEEPSEQYSSAA
ncbi:sigma factor [Streptomyces sp. OE57]|uniref:sigma factor n=1 Tax=Streptomyces lacaronensis TaxID=3379885 RepID=UPI0039B72D61